MTFKQATDMIEDIDVDSLKSYDELLAQKGLTLYQIRGLKKVLKMRQFELRSVTGMDKKDAEAEIKIIKRLLVRK